MNSTRNFWLNKKILLTGGSGFLGKHVYIQLLKKGASKKNILIPRSSSLDLRKRINCQKVTKDIDLVIHLAGNVGGIGKNQKLPATLLYDNLVMGTEIIEAARVNKVNKFVCLGTICAYPKYTQIPFKELKRFPVPQPSSKIFFEAPTC
ncbi:MAG: NAD-dependent epimerase/dehydratase [Candidatus Daviesbacteria bacterium GW2011_GWA1_36_8]|uniref:NAD-dependent epimerase/dehydratase n=1 Tax=Candidatus Daviesbacteria bacterium GW2011_GWA1_36_8 TaxID=1618417 RepID=A0A0G0F9A6_9BACT|nr:MAG: NAD-dependent epimerase/dehydratase [Candidatus Daviesbacteria bacterium GW2011_GWA1_36_8]